MRATPPRPALFALALALVLAARARPARADSLVLVDGRTVDCPKAEKQPDGAWLLHFKNGDVALSKDLVKDAWVMGAQGYVPQNDLEKANLEKGLVPYEGKWIPKAERDAKAAKRAAEAKKRIDEAKAHREWRNRYRMKTSNFDVEYTIPTEIAKNYMDLMEAFFGYYLKEFHIPKPKERLKVCFYHDYETFLQVAGAGSGALAYYRFVPPREINFFYDRLNPDDTVAAMFHECQHYTQHLMDLRFDMPHQLGEAFSEYYGAGTWDPVKKQMAVGGVQEGRLTEVQTDLAKGDRPTLDKYLRGLLGYDDYTWGWTFVHYMMSTPKYAKKFKAFYAALPEGKDVTRTSSGFDMVTVKGDDVVAAFKKYMGVDDLAPLEKEWFDYVETGLKVSSVAGLEKAAFAAKRAGRDIRAKRLFEEALAKGSKNPVLYLRYGEMVSYSDSTKAEALFRRGLELDPLSAALWTELGLVIKRREGAENEANGKKLIQLAAEIDPESVETWMLVEEAMEKTGPAPKPPSEGGGK